MAGVVRSVSLLPFAARKQEAVDYLRQRDDGPPTGEVFPGQLVQVPGTPALHVLTWSFRQEVPPDGVAADGFALHFARGERPDPAEGIQLVPITQLSHVFTWPPGVAVSYAIALFRWTYQGYREGLSRIGAGWSGVAVGGFASKHHVGEDLAGTKDGTNVLFTWPFAIALDANGRPAGQLLFRISRSLYSATDPPPPGYWTLVDPSTLKVAASDAPWPGDVLQWDWAMEA